MTKNVAKDIKDIWDKIAIEPDLREFIILSAKDVAILTEQALRQSDPAAWLSEQLNERGCSKRATIETHNEKRMADDAAFFRDFSRWPGDVCNVKEQPWVKANGRRFGRVYASDFRQGRWTVEPEGETPETFNTIEEMVKVWSVD